LRVWRKKSWKKDEVFSPEDIYEKNSMRELQLEQRRMTEILKKFQADQRTNVHPDIISLFSTFTITKISFDTEKELL
jgi:hypothetical protein